MRKRKLLFAVQPKDAFSPKTKVVGNCDVKINDGDITFIKNRSGFYCVTNKPAGEYSITISNKFYCKQTVVINTNDLDANLPAFDMELEPNLTYAFPKGTTLIRGRVSDSEGVDITGAVVTLDDNNKEFVTDNMGRFTFYFKQVEDDTKEVELTVNKSGYLEKEVEVEITKGEVNKLNITLESD